MAHSHQGRPVRMIDVRYAPDSDQKSASQQNVAMGQSQTSCIEQAPCKSCNDLLDHFAEHP